MKVNEAESRTAGVTLSTGRIPVIAPSADELGSHSIMTDRKFREELVGLPYS